MDIQDMPKVEPTGGGTNGVYKPLDPARVNAILEYPDLIAEMEAKIAARNEQEAGRKRRKLITYADIEQRIHEAHWIWYPYFPAGVLTMLAADSGVGKTAAAVHIGKHFLFGTPFPDGTECPRSEYIMLCDTEIFQAENIKRMRTWGIPRERVIYPLEDPSEDFMFDNQTHLDCMRDLAEEYKPGAIIVDSLSGGHNQDEISVETGRAIKRFAHLIANLSYQPLVLMTHHLNGGSNLEQGSPPVTMRRIRGHTSTRQYFRVIHGIHTPDPTQPNVKRLHFVKTNLSEFGAPLGFRWTPDGCIEWCEPPKVESDANLATSQALSTGKRAEQILRDMLNDGPMPGEDIIAAAEEAGVPEKTLYRIRQKLGVATREKDGYWYLQ